MVHATQVADHRLPHRHRFALQFPAIFPKSTIDRIKFRLFAYPHRAPRIAPTVDKDSTTMKTPSILALLLALSLTPQAHAEALVPGSFSISLPVQGKRGE